MFMLGLPGIPWWPVGTSTSTLTPRSVQIVADIPMSPTESFTAGYSRSTTSLINP
jgi:hypothetical protein